MGVRAIALGLVLAALAAPPGHAQKTKFDSLRQCEHYAAVQFRRSNPDFRHFLIDRASVREDKYADMVGTQFISTIFHGRGTYEAGNEARSVRFICLHPGYGKQPVFVYLLPE
jgi:hypothetical protein